METVVCMAVYNGLKYINEQLESIRMQTMPAGRVLLRDDCSTDGSAEFIEKYIVKNNLAKNWFLIRGEKNIGWKANYGELLKTVVDEYENERKRLKSTGMIMNDSEMLIILSDQDDIWREDRIERTLEAFSQNENAELLVGSFDFLDENGEKTPYSKNTGIILRRDFDGRFFHTRMPGCVYAARVELLAETKHYWTAELPHDAQLWMFAMIRHSLFTYDIPLIDYRRHRDTATGTDCTTEKTKLRDLRREKEQIRVAIEYNKESDALSRREREILDKAKRYCLARENLFRRKTLAAAVRAMQYLENYSSFRTFLGDLFFCLPQFIRIGNIKGKQF